MDERWKSHVNSILTTLVRILIPISLIDRLLEVDLITVPEYERLSLDSIDDETRSRRLLVSILPKRGPDSFDRFLKVLKETKGQEHVAKTIMESWKREKPIGERSEEEFVELERELEKEKKDRIKCEATIIGLRTKIGPSMGNRSLKWETNMPNMPIDCWPSGCVAEINGMLHIGQGNRMLKFKKGAWEGEEHHLPGIFFIRSVFECEGKGYVMDINEKGQCLSIYEWKSETRETELLTKIPDKYTFYKRLAIGHNEKIYLVGGNMSDRVHCFDINKKEWKPIKKMKNKRDFCSLALINDKLFVGGGEVAGNSVECFLMEKHEWINIKSTTKGRCELSSWNGKLVATGGLYASNHVEMYDELSGDWLPLPSMNEGRRLHGACTTKDNRLIVVGGAWGAWNSVECLKM